VKTFDGSAFAEDTWVHVDDDSPPPREGAFTVTLARWLEERDTVADPSLRRGVRLAPDEDPVALHDATAEIDLIVLSAPTFKDGRLFSQAALLRRRLGFVKEIRARGHVLPDQFPLLRRCGVDTVELATDAPELAWRQAASRYARTYQADVRWPRSPRLVDADEAGPGVEPSVAAPPRPRVPSGGA